MRIVAAPDKFRGTANAADVAAAIAEAAERHGLRCDLVPLADGGEGTLEALGGANRSTVVTGPLGEPVTAAWRLDRGRAVIEMARASGLEIAGGAEGNDPINATTAGTGELISAAIESGARRIIVGVGGSATTDGGLGAVRALHQRQRLRNLELLVACDVRTRFVDAAEVFAPQKGATPKQVQLLKRRLERLAQVYLDDYGVDVSEVPGAGAAGGLAGGLHAVGAALVGGFDLVADEVRLHERLEGADLVVTGEGFVDDQSFDGKVVGGVVTMARQLGVPVLVVCGQAFDNVEQRVRTVSLVERFGTDAAMGDTLRCVRQAVSDFLAAPRR
ncbi:MAG: glycerate kinase [Acidimicrobiia bacterium]